MDDIDREIINTLQQGFPVCPSPYQQIARKLELTENELLQRLARLLNDGILTRFGPLYNAERMGGELTLAALKVAKEKFSETAAIINAFPEVAHNYARNHELNMWFVLATEKPGRVAQILHDIERQTGCHVYNMPKLKEYFVKLQLPA